MFIDYIFIIVSVVFTFYVFLEGDIDALTNILSIKFISIYVLLITIFKLLDCIYLYINKDKKKKNKKNIYIKDNVISLKNKKNEILELNNDMPIWWNKLFIYSIFISIIYFLGYLTTNFANPIFEYNISDLKYIKQVNYYERIRPQKNINTSTYDYKQIEEGKKLFNELCSTCHGIYGEGNIGPNLTDKYWINVNKNDLYKNIFYVIYYGSKNNPSMKAFGVSGEIKGNDIEKISSYVYYINKTNIKPKNHKIPEGNFIDMYYK